MSALPDPTLRTFTAEGYLAIERDPEAPYEYLDGYIYAMSGGSGRHNTISSNIGGLLWLHLRGGSCRGYGSDQKEETISWVPSLAACRVY